jgi:hypothetical protein
VRTDAAAQDRRRRVDGRRAPPGCAFFEAAHDVAPWACRVDDDASAHPDLAGPETIDDGCAGCARRLAAGVERDELHVVRDDRAGRGRTERVREREPCVVGRGVVVQRAADQSIAEQLRLLRRHVVRPQATVSADILKQREGVVEHEPCDELPSAYACPSIYRPGEGQWPHEMRREPQQPATLGTRLEDEVQATVLEIAHTPVYEAG